MYWIAMKIDNLTRLLLLLVGALVTAPPDVVSAQPIATSYKVVAGEAHPDFLYPRISDKSPVSLSEYRGKKVLLLHFASW